MFSLLPLFPTRAAADCLARIIETNVAIICACLPCLRALAARFFPALMVSSQKQVPLGLETISVTRLTRESVHVEQGGDGDVKEYKPNDPNDTMWIESRPASVLCEEADAGLVGVPLSPTHRYRRHCRLHGVRM